MASGEKNQALGTLEFLLDVADPVTDKPFGDTMSNLESAAASEIHEANELFPKLATVAREEEHHDVGDWFEKLSMAQTNHWDSIKQRSAELDPEGSDSTQN